MLDSYHQSNAEGVNLSVADLANIVLAHQNKDPDYYKGVLTTLDSLDATSNTTEHLIQSYYHNRLLKEIALTAYDVVEGNQKKEVLNTLLREYSEDLEVPEEEKLDEFVTDDIEQLLNSTFRQPGLRWRLSTLNRMLGSLRPGDFGFIFARPETGKTTFLASETTYMASQLGENDGPIIWFNNEEQDDKVKVRTYQATLGHSLVQVNGNPKAAQETFLEITKGKHKLFLNRNGGISRDTVEQVVARHRPRLVIFDQIDKITGFAADRDDLLLGAIYQWARELAKKYNMSVIAVCQADASGEGQKWLTMANVANAKTAKQAEADWILGIGKVHDNGYERVRYLHASKNKLSGDEDTDPALRHGKCEVLISPQIARYEDIN